MGGVCVGEGMKERPQESSLSSVLEGEKLSGGKITIDVRAGVDSLSGGWGGG